MSKKHLFILFSGVSLFFMGCKEQQSVQKVKTQEVEKVTERNKKYIAKQVENDPFNTHIYTLDNGLKVYISVNKVEPRVQTMIAVRTGSRNDPADATGLAHYLEHMLFKGTSKLGTIDWEKESKLLKEIADLYEEHRGLTDPEQRAAIYRKIDSVSNKASEYAVANEYDKMVASIGAKGTNAYTSVEQTVYINDIPANEIEKWLAIESERFRELVLRLFHTELEAVYEEFNISQDVDARKGNKALAEALFPTHSYGTQTTIGEGEHLKNPSHYAIQKYFKEYYVPNNMAIILAGDVDPDAAIRQIDEYFGGFESKPVTPRAFPEQPVLEAPVVKEVIGNEEPYVDIAYRLPSVKSKAGMMMELVSGILNNSKAGIMDVNVLQQQKAREADAWSWGLNDYSIFGLYGKPVEGQSLQELKELILSQVELLKQGEFEDWLIPAVIKNKKLKQLNGLEGNRNRANVLVSAFVHDENWDKYVSWYDEMGKITKAEVVAFANEYFNENYAVVFKRTREDTTLVKVDKPTITPLEINRASQSEFFQAFEAMGDAKAIEPDFVDYTNKIETIELGDGAILSCVKNESNDLFSYSYIFDKGKLHHLDLSLASIYIPYLGTDKYTLEELKKELFKRGLSFEVRSGEEEFLISLSGLDEALDEGVVLLEHIITSLVVNEPAFERLVNDVVSNRAAAKQDKRTILRSGLGSFAKYGATNSFTHRYSQTELEEKKPEDILAVFKALLEEDLKVYYYGSRAAADVKAVVESSRLKNRTTKTALFDSPVKFDAVGAEQDEVYFLDFPMVQVEVLMLSKGTDGFSAEEYIMNELYNNYFGYGLSSIVFQEIRESKALAYSTYAYAGSPSKKKDAHFFQAYVGTQPDKLKQAVTHMKQIINEMPVSETQIESARQSILKKIESERISAKAYYSKQRIDAERGTDASLRQKMYNKIASVTVEELVDYQNDVIKNRAFRIMVLGDKEQLDWSYLQTLGEVKELDMEEVFGY